MHFALQDSNIISRWEEKGMKVYGVWLNNLRFADDVVLISSSVVELQEMAEELIDASRISKIRTEL